ncbi:MAG: putative sulfate exporter family transporter [Mucinivorans sp.]
MQKLLFFLLVIFSLFVPPAVALFAGIAYALLYGSPYLAIGKKISKFLLQASVVGLGFGMNLHSSLEAGREGMLFTIISVTGVMIVGYILGRYLHIEPRMAHMISSGTAICGGSAIAAIAPVVGANENETSVSLSIIFTLNAIALFIFPPLGHLFGLSQIQFGTWAAIAIHDTSSVVGAGAAYGEQALMVATTVKLMRALWIIPLALVSMLFFRAGGHKISIPWFIFLFIAAMILNTYLPLPTVMNQIISQASHCALSLTLFLIGSALSLKALRSVGLRPVVMGVILWVVISTVTLFVIL